MLVPLCPAQAQALLLMLKALHGFPLHCAAGAGDYLVAFVWLSGFWEWVVLGGCV